MEITGKTLKHALPVHQPVNGEARLTVNATPGTPETKTDTVALSTDVEDVREAMRTLNRMPDVREDKVAEMKRRLASGTYRIAGEMIAAQLIEETMQNNDILDRIDEGHK